MRIILALLFAALATPAFAQAWERYDNGRFGYSIAVPPGFVGQGESDNGDGQSFALDGRPITLAVWGGMMMEPDFSSEADVAVGYAEEAAWNITAETITPRWASFSAIQGSRILHQRLIALCEPGTYAALRVEYSVTDSADMEPLVGRLDKSLRAGDC